MRGGDSIAAYGIHRLTLLNSDYGEFAAVYRLVRMLSTGRAYMGTV